MMNKAQVDVKTGLSEDSRDHSTDEIFKRRQDQYAYRAEIKHLDEHYQSTDIPCRHN